MANLNIEFYSNCLCRPVQFKMLIPNDFSDGWQPEQKRKGKRMKTLFLLHGYSGSAGNWMPEYMASLYNFCIVMPTGENGFWVDGISTGHRFGTFLAVELVDYVRSTFHLAMNAEETYIMGLSMGGYGALHTALLYPDRFSKAAGLSSALILEKVSKMKPGDPDSHANYEYYRECFGNTENVLESDHNPEVLVDRILKTGGRMPELLMACGTEDFLLENNRAFHRFLDMRGVNHVYMESPGTHDMKFWQEYACRFGEMMFDTED